MELLDQYQLAIDLLERTLISRHSVFAGIARARAVAGALAKKRVHRLAVRNWILRELITEILERKDKTRGKLEGVGYCFGQIGEELPHCGSRLQITFRISSEQSPGVFNLHVVANTGQHIGKLTTGGAGITHAVSGQQREPEPSRYLDHCLIARFFFAIEMALKLGIDVISAEYIHKPFG